MQTTADAILSTGPDTVVTSWNPGAERMFGYSAEEMIGRPIGVLVPDERRDEQRRLIEEERTAGRELTGFETERIAKDGRRVSVDLTLFPIRDDSGAVVGSSAILRDISAETEARRERVESEERFRTVFERAPIGMALVSLEGTYMEVNAALCRSLDRPRDEFVGLTASDVTHPADLSERLASDDQLLTGEEGAHQTERRFMRPDGSVICTRATTSVVRDAQGRPLYMLCQTEDITERAREARELADSRVRLQEAQEIARIGAWEWDIVRHRVIASDGLLELIGRSREEFEKTPTDTLESVAHPDDREILKQQMRRRLEGAEDSYGYRIVRPDGSVRHVQSRGRVELGSDGRPVKMIGTLQDVTEQRVAEEERERLLRRNELLLGAIAEGVYGLNGEGRMTFVNPAASRMLGWELEELIGCDAHELVHHSRPDGSAYPAEECPWVLAARDGSVLKGADEFLIRKDGSTFPVEYNCNPIHEDGRLMGTVMSFTDITERKLADEGMRSLFATLQEADHERRVLLTHLVGAQEAERERIAADIHDDSVQAMSAVALRLEMLRKTALEPDAAAMVRRLEETVGMATTRLRHLLFELSPPALEHGGLASGVGAILEELSAEAGFEYRIDNRLKSEPPQERRIVLYRIAQEALGNVRKHARANRVSVVLESLDEGVLVRIQDDGVGLDPHAVKRPRPGHLGLVSMRQRAEVAGGWTRVESARGAGTIVEYWVPNADHADLPPIDWDGAGL